MRNDPWEYRCEKHLERLPCCIEGCGKTFAFKGDDSYDNVVMCGACWRQGPKRKRDLCSRIRRKAKRIGWSDQLAALHHRLWWQVHAEVTAGKALDLGEIERMFGP